MKHSAVVLISGFLVLLWFVTGEAQELKWRNIRPAGQEFTVEVPGIPTREGRIILIEKDIQLVPDVYDLVANNVRYQIMSFGHPASQKFSLFVERFQHALVAGN